jgi:predicted ribosome quality control (RQC) complex YloA/Tae2 family protein
LLWQALEAARLPHLSTELSLYLAIDVYHLPPVTIPFDALMLSAVIAELSERICGGKIQDLRHSEPNELQIGIYTEARTQWLNVSVDARFARVHLTRHRAANSPIPTEFCLALRRHIEGGRITAVTQVGQDRILEISILRGSDEGGQIRCKLVIELMGKHSNIILINSANRIIESAKRVSHRINRIRETLPGLAYSRPPGVFDSAIPPLGHLADAITLDVGAQINVASVAAAIRRRAPFVSPFLAVEIAHRSTLDNLTPHSDKFGVDCLGGLSSIALRDRLWDTFDMIYNKRSYQPVSVTGCRGAGAYPIPLLQVPPELQERVPSLNDALEIAYANLMLQIKKLEAGDRLRSEIDQEIARQSRVVSSSNRTIDEASRAEMLSQSGELLLANLWKINPGDAEITVIDYYDGTTGERTIRLDPKLSGQENASVLFNRARRARKGLETARTRLDSAEAKTDALNMAIEQLRALTVAPEFGEKEIRDLGLGLKNEGLLPTTSEARAEAEPEFQGHRIRREITPDGYEILVGESATANDFLTTRIARPNDLWLHVRSAVGGHVVIRTAGKPEDVPAAVIERAAVIAARHSAQKHSSLVAVDYTRKKYVRKPRTAAPGSVVLEREKTLHVSPGEA